MCIYRDDGGVYLVMCFIVFVLCRRGTDKTKKRDKNFLVLNIQVQFIGNEEEVNELEILNRDAQNDQIIIFKKLNFTKMTKWIQKIQLKLIFQYFFIRNKLLKNCL